MHKLIVRPMMRADSPMVTANTAFMVHVLLETLEEADRQPPEERAGSRAFPGNDRNARIETVWSNGGTA